jgi:hypothetical protein
MTIESPRMKSISQNRFIGYSFIAIVDLCIQLLHFKEPKNRKCEADRPKTILFSWYKLSFPLL